MGMRIYLTNLDGRQWLLFVYLPGMIALLTICITLALAFLPRLYDKRNEPLDKYHLRTCRALHEDTESSRYWEARRLLER
ncbi:hypothetical protein NPIL_391751 [Nephila pilipes]|uniref:Uncharacterized protein n=1 Tax=Nephila pilipes TaxID=299642 RepID=A0A8X6QWH3_NEPPI|nr:hypothetical protein NPIL_391751 [Nephila pilipes]